MIANPRRAILINDDGWSRNHPGNRNEYVPRRQYSHLAHDETPEITIRSAARKVVTPSPTEIDHANAVPMDACRSASGSAAFENVQVRAADVPA